MIITTPRLGLREMSPEDRPALSAILQDPQTMYAYEGPFSDDEVTAWLDSMLTSYAERGYGLWAVVLQDTGQMIGQCGLTQQHILDRDVVEVGYLFNRAHWHRGYAIEAARACRDYAFGTLNLDRVWCQVRDTNIASMNVAIRLGMTVRGRFIKHYRGATMPHLAFALDRADASTDAAS